MGYSFRAARVYQTAKINQTIPGARTSAPLWLKVIERIPPSDLLARPKPIPHHAPNPKQRRPRNIFKPQKITYPEDELRRTFFKDHPWELARPRVAVELDGKDGRYVDWSQGLRQPGMQVTGESVVQRQLWLMENGIWEDVKNEETGEVEKVLKELSQEGAYDIARKELYLERQQEDITRRIAQEEARVVGAYFGKNRLQVSMELEDKTYEKWKLWADSESLKIKAARESAYTNFGSETTPTDTDVEAEIEAEIGAGEAQPTQ